MSGIIVDNDMDRFPSWYLCVDDIKEADELVIATTLTRTADGLAFQHIERRKQRRNAVTLVIVRVMVPARPFFIGSPGWVRSSAWIWLTWGFVGQDVRIKITS